MTCKTDILAQKKKKRVVSRHLQQSVSCMAMYMMESVDSVTPYVGMAPVCLSPNSDYSPASFDTKHSLDHCSVLWALPCLKIPPELYI